MRLLYKSQIHLEWSDINGRVRHPYPEHVRSSGRHVTEILTWIARNNGRLGPEEERDLMPLVMGIGMAWEEWAVGMYPGMHWQPGEVNRDEISGNPDGFSLISLDEIRLSQAISLESEPMSTEHVAPCIEEFKATFKSIRTRPNLDNEWLWIQQVMSYLNMHVLRPVVARFHVLWIAGDYKFPLVPQYWTYVYEFGSRELKENWAMMLREKDNVK